MTFFTDRVTIYNFFTDHMTIYTFFYLNSREFIQHKKRGIVKEIY